MLAFNSGITYLAKYFWITENDHSIFCTRESNVQPPRIVQKPNSLVLIASDTAEDNIVLLTTLKGVHGSDLYLLVEVLLQRTIILHIVHDIRALSFIRRHNADLARYNTGLEELRDNFLNI
jgi:hypothetical protein